MQRPGILVMVLAACVGALAGCGSSGEDVDRAAYVSENRRLLNQIPRFPGARRVGLHNEATYRVFDYDDGCFFWCGSFINGYITHVTFQSPDRTTADEITRFFERKLRHSDGAAPTGASFPRDGHVALPESHPSQTSDSSRATSA